MSDEIDAELGAPQIRYLVGDNPFDRFLLWAGAALFVAGVAFFIDTPQIGYAGAFFLAWTMTRRWRERRQVAVFNRRERPVGTLDDDGFA